jgi:hypothetical protein
LRVICALLCCAALIGLPGASVSGQGCASEHLCNANTLIDNLLANGKRNEYDNTSDPSYIIWDPPAAEAYTNCSTFITELLKHTYHWDNDDIRQWMGASVPTAAMYHDKIWDQDRFVLRQTYDEIEAGDFIAIKYPAGSPTSGHILIVAERPEQIQPEINPQFPNIRQFAVRVVDSSKSYHGSTDTRYPNGQGIGRGVFRIYVDSTDNIVGYTWSTYPNSTFYSQTQHHLVVGQLE